MPVPKSAPVKKKNARKRAARRPDHIKLADQLDVEAGLHEQGGRHAEAHVLRDVVARLRGDKADGSE